MKPLRSNGLSISIRGETVQQFIATLLDSWSKGSRDWVYKKQGERAQTLKQARLLREERHNEDKRAKGGKGSDDPGPKAPRPKKGPGAKDKKTEEG